MVMWENVGLIIKDPIPLYTPHTLRTNSDVLIFAIRLWNVLSCIQDKAIPSSYNHCSTLISEMPVLSTVSTTL